MARTGAITLVDEVVGPRATTVVRMCGEIDGALRAAASRTLVGVIQRDRRVVVDLGDVSFVDSAGIAFLLQLVQVGREQGFPVLLRDAPQRVVDVLELIGVRDDLPDEDPASRPADETVGPRGSQIPSGPTPQVGARQPVS